MIGNMVAIDFKDEALISKHRSCKNSAYKWFLCRRVGRLQLADIIWAYWRRIVTKSCFPAMAASAVVMWIPAQACGASEFSELGLGDPSSSPCLAQGIDKLKSDVFLYVSNPADLLMLVSVVACSHGVVEDDQREIENFIASPIPYVAENFPSEQGPIDRTEVVASPGEIAQLVASSALYVSYVDISISRSDTAVLQVSSDVCTLQLNLHISGDGWNIQAARNLCD